MGLFNAFATKSFDISSKQIYLEYGSLLFDGEIVERAVKMDRDKLILTDSRIILILKCKGDKYEFVSVPYSNVRKFSILSKGVKEQNAALNIFLYGEDKPIRRVLNNCETVNEIYRFLGKHLSKVQTGFALLNEVKTLKLN
ncbi:MAG: PH domain-containing protein [Pyrinomonadaceae bacterium]|nr:PH domain-containing protein [Sphingobacteriaceae bacterium]